MSTAQQVYQMLGNENLWETAALCHAHLDAANIDYSICGGVAVCLHGYQRNTVDIDLIVRANDTEQVKQTFIAAGFKWDSTKQEFNSDSNIVIQFLIAGESAGRGTEVKIPEPTGSNNVEPIDGLNVVRLSRLIEMKLACGTSNLRRTHKDFADVVELIDKRRLDSSFARFLHKSLRKTFRDLVKRVQSDNP